MNLYLLTQDDQRGYDTYDSMVVAAENEDDARHVHPYGEREWDAEFRSSAWASSPELVTAELIGVATEGTERGIVLSSFNAG